MRLPSGSIGLLRIIFIGNWMLPFGKTTVNYSKKVKNAARNFSVATKMALTILKNEKTTKEA